MTKGLTIWTSHYNLTSLTFRGTQGWYLTRSSHSDSQKVIGWCLAHKILVMAKFPFPFLDWTFRDLELELGLRTRTWPRACQYTKSLPSGFYLLSKLQSSAFIETLEETFYHWAKSDKRENRKSWLNIEETRDISFIMCLLSLPDLHSVSVPLWVLT